MNRHMATSLRKIRMFMDGLFEITEPNGPLEKIAKITEVFRKIQIYFIRHRSALLLSYSLRELEIQILT